MALPTMLQGLRIPAFGAPLFIVQNPDLVIAQCKAGIPGCVPALNAREKPGEPPVLDAWLTRIREELDRHNQANPDRPAASRSTSRRTSPGRPTTNSRRTPRTTSGTRISTACWSRPWSMAGSS